MSYSGLGYLGALEAATYPSNTQLVAGYRIVGLTRPAGEVPGLLREAMQAAFRGATLRTGWGGGSGSAGVPSGHVYAVVETRAPGVTSDTMNGIFSRVASALQSRLGGGTVTNTHAHVVRGGGGPAVSPSDIVPSASLPGALPGVLPPGDGLLPGSDPGLLPVEEPSFFSQTVGGVPMWGVLLGGTALVGAAAYVLMSSRKQG